MDEEYRKQRDAALKADREWAAKKEAERKAKGVPEPAKVPVVPAPMWASLEPMEQVEINERPSKPFIKYIKSIQDAPDGDRQDFVVSHHSRLHKKIEEDAQETRATQYIVLNEGDQYCVWRMPR